MDNCIVCDTNKFAYRPYGQGFCALSKEVRIQICLTCGLGQVIPLPDGLELEAYYKADQYQKWHSSEKLLEMESLPHSRALSQYDLLAGYLDFNSIQTVLDFGAGSAPTTRTIKIRHPYIITSAVELSKSLRGLLIDCNEVDVVYETLPQVIGQYDLIIVSQTLEHLVDPLGDIRKFRHLLKPGGLLFIEVPNCPYPFYYDVNTNHQPHLFFFMDCTFKSMAWRLGFKLMYSAGLGVGIEEFKKAKNMLDIVIRTGLCYAPNKKGVYLRALLKKGDK